MKLLVVLQNAYGVTEDYIPAYSHKGFANSHTGRRLREVLPENYEIEIINSTLKIGDNANSRFPPDKEYVAKKLIEFQPDIILACGINARDVLRELEVTSPIIFMPHPACRTLSKNLTSKVRRELEHHARTHGM